MQLQGWTAALQVGATQEDSATNWVRERKEREAVGRGQPQGKHLGSLSDTQIAASNFSKFLEVLKDSIDTTELVLRLNKENREKNKGNTEEQHTLSIVDIEPLYEYITEITADLEASQEKVPPMPAHKARYEELLKRLKLVRKGDVAATAEGKTGGSGRRRRRIKRRKTRKTSKKSKRRKTKKKKRRSTRR